MKRILIVERNKEERHYWGGYLSYLYSDGTPVPMKHLFQANIVVVKHEDCFDCVKNRWGRPATNIPMELLFPYLSIVTKHLSREELLNDIL